jgi:hypothetical protein
MSQQGEEGPTIEELQTLGRLIGEECERFYTRLVALCDGKKTALGTAGMTIFVKAIAGADICTRKALIETARDVVVSLVQQHNEDLAAGALAELLGKKEEPRDGK